MVVHNKEEGNLYLANQRDYIEDKKVNKKK